MRTELNTESTPDADAIRTVPLAPGDLPEAAEVLVQTYANHPGYDLHAEVRSADSAMAFISSVIDGGFGAPSPEYCRVLRLGGSLAGIVIGAEVAPDVGFVIQVAVRPAYRGTGHGTALLNEIAAAFIRAGMSGMALGVTWDDPARRLYERQGFVLQKRMNAYAWWRS